MTLFNSTGFNVNDRVSVILENQKYFGIVTAVDERLDRVKVNYSSDIEREVKNWFHKSFWEKVK